MVCTVHVYAKHFLKRSAAQMGKTLLSNMCGKARLALAIIRASSLCLRGSRVKWSHWRSGLGFDVVSYSDPDSHSCEWITSPLRGGAVIHPKLWGSGSGYETRFND